MKNEPIKSTGKPGRPLGGDSDQIRVRLEGELKEKWRKMLEDRGVTQQRAILALLDFMVNTDAITQLMVMRQVDDGDVDALTEIVLKRLAERKAARKPKGK